MKYLPTKKFVCGLGTLRGGVGPLGILGRSYPVETLGREHDDLANIWIAFKCMHPLGVPSTVQHLISLEYGDGITILLLI